MKAIVKRAGLGVMIAVGTVIVSAGVFIGVLTIAEYRPAETETPEITYHHDGGARRTNEGALTVPVLPLPAGDAGDGIINVPVSVLSWNIGYASLDESQNFFKAETLNLEFKYSDHNPVRIDVRLVLGSRE